MGIQMKRKELTKTFMMTSNCTRTLLVSMVYIKNISALVNPLTAVAAYIRVFIFY